MKCEDGEMLHIRKSTAPEPRQKVIYDALKMRYYPGGAVKKKMKIKKSVVPRTNCQNA
jgi:hypothetical protein